MVEWLGGWVVGWWMVGWVVGWVDGWLGGWLGGWLSGWVVGWLSGWVVGLECAADQHVLSHRIFGNRGPKHRGRDASIGTLGQPVQHGHLLVCGERERTEREFVALPLRERLGLEGERLGVNNNI